jgi:hypothetical protein
MVVRDAARAGTASFRWESTRSITLPSGIGSRRHRPILPNGLNLSRLSYFDVIDYHSYDRQAPVGVLERITRASGKPTMISEFSFRAMDSGLPNTKGPGEPVGTQEERAKVFADYAGTLASLPNCIGYHWFQYRDEPKQGRSVDYPLASLSGESIQS